MQDHPTAADVRPACDETIVIVEHGETITVRCNARGQHRTHGHPLPARPDHLRIPLCPPMTRCDIYWNEPTKLLTWEFVGLGPPV